MTILQLENVSLRFKGASKPALHKMNYTLEHEDFIIVLGSNGSGKSTLLKLLHRQHRPDTGKIHFQGKPIQLYPSKTFAQQVRVLTQNCNDSFFASLTLYENYLLVKQEKNFKLISHRQEKSFLHNYLSDFNPNLSHQLDLPMEQFSGGEKQAAALAFCLLRPPALLLLDEHTSALDPRTSEQIMLMTQRMLTKYKITCLLTTHDLDIALRYGNRILMLREGEIYQALDKQQNTLTKEILIKHYY